MLLFLYKSNVILQYGISIALKIVSFLYLLLILLSNAIWKWLTFVGLFWTHILQPLLLQKVNVKMGRLGGNSTTTFMIALGNKFRTAVLIRRGRKYLSYMLHLLYCYAQRFSHHIFLPFTLVVFGYVFFNLWV